MKVLWLSRHPLGAEQVADLSATLGCDVEVTTQNVTLPANSRDALTALRHLAVGFDVVTGVFPAHIAAAAARLSAWAVGDNTHIWHGIVPSRPYTHMWVPVSVPAPAAHGETRGFQHSHWECLTKD